MKLSDFKLLIKEAIEESIQESLVSGFKVTSLEDFVDNEITEGSEDMLGAKTSKLSPDELSSYIKRSSVKGADKYKSNTYRSDKMNMPFIHPSNVKIKDEKDRPYDLEKLKSAIKERPKVLLKKNDKMGKSGGESSVFFDLGLPALKGLAVNEKTDEFVVVDTCPGAGACKAYCYAKKGGYVQFPAANMSQTKRLNFLLNDPAGFKSLLLSELRSITKKFGKSGSKIVVRWHDAGDFFSPEYLKLAYSVAKEFPNVDFYAYTKMAGVAMGDKPDNFKMNFSMGATPEQEKQVDLSKTKHSTVVPKQMFQKYMVTDERGKYVKDEDGRIQFKSEKDLQDFKNALAVKHKIKPDSVITYSELMDTPPSTEKKWNVIVRAGDGDDAANRGDVLGTYLLIH